jgi:hypothetical protein
METVNNIRKEFDELKELRQSINSLFNNLTSKISSLQNLYVGFVQKGKAKESSFGIDSLHFQRRYMEEEHNGMKRMFCMIGNQIYRDYYKMHKVVWTYVSQNVIDSKVRANCTPRRSYTIYKDLEPFKEYDFEEVVELHHDLTHVIVELLSYTSTKEREWKSDQGKAHHGINIDNFVTTEKYMNQQMEHKALMFIEYLQVFHKFHLKYLSRFSMKLRLMYSQIQKDIILDESNGSSPEHMRSEREDVLVLARTSSADQDVADLRCTMSELDKSPLIKQELAELIDEMAHQSDASSVSSDRKEEQVSLHVNEHTESPNREVVECVNESLVNAIENSEGNGGRLTEQQKQWLEHNKARSEKRRQKLALEKEEAAGSNGGEKQAFDETSAL